MGQQFESLREQQQREETSLKGKLQHEEHEVQTLRRRVVELEDQLESATHNAQLMTSMATQLEAKMDSAIAVTSPLLNTNLEAIESDEVNDNLGYSAMVGGHHAQRTITVQNIGLGQGTLRSLMRGRAGSDSVDTPARKGHAYGDTQQSTAFAQLYDADTWKSTGSAKRAWDSTDMGAMRESMLMGDEEEKVEEMGDIDALSELREEMERMEKDRRMLVERHEIEQNAMEKEKEAVVEECKAHRKTILELNQQLRQMEVNVKNRNTNRSSDEGACVVFGYSAW